MLTAIGDISQCLLLAMAFLCVVSNVKSGERRAQLFWWLLSLGVGLWLGAQILWTYFEVLLRREVPNPFVGDVILFLHLVPMMGAVAVQPHLERDSKTSRLGAIDFVLLFLWWLYLYLFVVIPWQYVSPNEALYGRGFDALYLGEHFVFLVCAAGVWVRSSGAWKTVYGHLLGAGLLYALGSISASVAIDLGRYYTGSIFDAPLTLSMVWFVAVGLIARKTLLRADPAPAGYEQKDGWVSAVAMVAMLSLPVTAGWSVYFSHATQGVRDFRLVLTLVTMLVMGALIWIKQFRLNDELSQATQELREDSLTDSLTGARNRRFLNTTIEADIRQAVRAYAPEGAQNKRNCDLAFYLIDADSFKGVNDRHGHPAGDKLLVELARRISSAIRHSDVLIRWGGDEFLVISRYTNRKEAGILARRVLQSVGKEPFEPEAGLRLRCTCSIGWAVFPWYLRAAETVKYEEVLQLADGALYEAKKQGRNRAIGMLPSAEVAGAEKESLIGRKASLVHRLGAQVVAELGPVEAETEQLAKAAFLGS